VALVSEKNYSCLYPHSLANINSLGLCLLVHLNSVAVMVYLNTPTLHFKIHILKRAVVCDSHFYKYTSRMPYKCCVSTNCSTENFKLHVFPKDVEVSKL
jgi:hypothetical protein